MHRVLARHGLVVSRSRRRKRETYRRWGTRQAHGAVANRYRRRRFLVDGTECKIVTGVDDYSRFCVMATVVVRATGRAVCLAFAQALHRYGVPEEVLTDNGKQFTDRFGKCGDVLGRFRWYRLALPAESWYPATLRMVVILLLELHATQSLHIGDGTGKDGS